MSMNESVSGRSVIARVRMPEENLQLSEPCPFSDGNLLQEVVRPGIKKRARAKIKNECEKVFIALRKH